MSESTRRFCARLGIEHPIVQAPMAGGNSTPAMVAAVSEAGGLGSLACAYMTPADITAAIADVRRRTKKPFAINLFAGGYEQSNRAPESSAEALAVLARHNAALGLPPPAMPAPGPDPTPAQFEAVLAARVPIFSFTFGIPPAALLDRFRRDGAYLIGTATTVGEARLLAEARVDAVLAQGSEAGAHRGTFAAPMERAMIGSMALVPQVVDAVPGLAVIAAGGIMDGRGIAAAEALGASATALGTAFLVTDEAGIPAAYKRRIATAQAEETKLTRAFSGRDARGIVNAFMEEMDALGDAAIPAFPHTNSLTRPMRTAAAKAGDIERLSLWAGQGAPMARAMPAAALLRKLVEEREAARRAFADQ